MFAINIRFFEIILLIPMLVFGHDLNNEETNSEYIIIFLNIINIYLFIIEVHVEAGR